MFTLADIDNRATFGWIDISRKAFTRRTKNGIQLVRATKFQKLTSLKPSTKEIEKYSDKFVNATFVKQLKNPQNINIGAAGVVRSFDLNGKKVVVKQYHGVPEVSEIAPHQVGLELLATDIANELDIPIARSKGVPNFLTKQLEASYPYVDEFPDDYPISTEASLISEFIDGKDLSVDIETIGYPMSSREFAEKMNRITSSTDLSKISAFDHLLQNIDRNPGNLLKTKSNNYIGIDHGLIMGQQWNPISMDSLAMYLSNPPTTLSSQQLDNLAAFKSTLKKGIETYDPEEMYERVNSYASTVASKNNVAYKQSIKETRSRYEQWRKNLLEQIYPLL